MKAHHRTRLFLPGLCALAACVAGIPAWAGENASRSDGVAVLREAERLVEDGQYRKAALEFERANAIFSESGAGVCGECLLGVARAYIGAGEAEAAVQVTRMALPLLKMPDVQARAYHQLGIALTRRGDLDGAQEALQKAVTLDGRLTRSIRPDLAEVLLRKGHPDEAAAMARQSLGEEPRDSQATALRSVLCRAKAVEPEDEAKSKKRKATAEPKIALTSANSGPGSDVPPAGTVVVQAVIDPDGCVQNARIVNASDDTLAPAALDAVKGQAFPPTTRQGRPVAVDQTLTVSFDDTFR